MGRARGQNAVMNLGFETAYGVPPASDYRQLPFVSSQLGAEQALIESDLLGRGRTPSDPTYDIVTNDGDVVVPLDSRAFGYWLRLLLGPATTTPNDIYFSHVFSSGAPSLATASIEIGHPDRPSFSTNYGVGANTLQISMQRSGLSSATIGLIAKGETVPSLTTNAGTPEVLTGIDRFASASGSIMIDNVVIGEVTAAQLSFSNGLDKDETIRADGEINALDAGMPTLSLSLTTKFADLVLYNKATSQTPVAVTLSWASPKGPTLVIALSRLFLPRSKRPITGPGGIMAEFRGIGSSATGAPALAVYLKNEVTSYA